MRIYVCTRTYVHIIQFDQEDIPSGVKEQVYNVIGSTMTYPKEAIDVTKIFLPTHVPFMASE